MIAFPHFVKAQNSWHHGTRACKLESEILQVVQNVANQSITRRTVVEESLGVDNLDFLLETGELVGHDARECRCGDAPTGTYCLILQDAEENYCEAEGSYTGRNKDKVPICYRRTLLFSFVKMYFAPICFAGLIILASIVTTRCGMHARNYVLSRCFPSINRRTVERILTREAARRQAFRMGLGIESLVLVQEHGAANRTRTNLSLKLKTKIFQPQSPSKLTEASTEENGSGGKDNTWTWPWAWVWNKDDIDDFGNQQEQEVCTICLVNLEPGDRIGALPCNHSFHVDCLKTWVLWRNTVSSKHASLHCFHLHVVYKKNSIV